MKTLIDIGAITDIVMDAKNKIKEVLGLSQPSPKEEISGAFGIKLGQVFNPEEHVCRKINTKGGVSYEFQPKTKPKHLDNYYVRITNKTKKVYHICGKYRCDNGRSCKRNQDLLVSVLEKYGKARQSANGAVTISQGDRFVSIRNSVPMIIISYFDKELSDLSDKEKIGLENDSSWL